MNYGQGFAEYTGGFEMAEIPTVTDIGIFLFMGFLLVAAIMDWETREVYNMIWMVAIAIWCVCLFAQMCGEKDAVTVDGRLAEVIIFALLQQFFFCRFYGRADCHAFCCSAMFLSLQGKGIVYYLLHMLIALGSLAIVQLLEKNINRKGNLKEPVAFVPYIAIAFVLVVLL